MLVILDRDGVINVESAEYVKSTAEWQAIPGSLEAIAQLNAAGHSVVVATNQSGVGRGFYTLETLHAIHEKMLSELTAVGGKIDHIYYCPHHPDEGCACRKPEPGMLLQAMSDFNAPCSETIFVGDSTRDIEAARAAGCTAALVLTGNGARAQAGDTQRFANLAELVAQL
jgi:D-glycero-D-manno-heptose 1,7-bisphosphate phosphatase